MGSLLLGGAAIVLYSGAAHSQTCSAAYKGGQEKEAAGHLVEAREQYSECARKVCGPFLLNACLTRHARLDSDIPSVVPVAADKSGQPYVHVKVTLDGRSFASGLDGRSLQVDPGVHEFVFTNEYGRSVTEKLLILEGDRNRRVAVSFGKHGGVAKAELGVAEEESSEDVEPVDHGDKQSHSDEPPHPSSALSSKDPPSGAVHSKGVPIASWVLGGVGALGGVGYLVFSSWGKNDNTALQNQCAPNCAQSSVDRVKQRYLAADISLGVGVAALGSAVLVYALRGRSEEALPEPQGYRVDVHPTSAGGAVASVSGSF